MTLERNNDWNDKQLVDRFFNMESPQDVAELLGVDYRRLPYYLYVADAVEKYRRFWIPKSSGGNREILAPTYPVKELQRRLNEVLQLVYRPGAPVHGFVAGRSIVTNAEVHAGQRFLFNLDLREFFPSINFGRVRGMFMAHPYNLPAPVATVLAQLCCFENQLPQGAPTSPTVSNMLCAKLDSQLQRLARHEGWRYTRYADDLSFSTSKRHLSGRIVTRSLEWDDNYVVRPGSKIESIIEENGFEINQNKVRLLVNEQHQEVTGLTTNEFPNVRRTYVRQIRAMLHAWRKFEYASAEEHHFRYYRKRPKNPYHPRPSFKEIVRGKIEFLGMVRGKDDPLYRKYWNQLVDLDPNIGQPLAPEPLASQEPPPEPRKHLEFLPWLETLPFPVASILWTYHTAGDERAKYEHLLHFFEAYAEFWATILMSGFHKDSKVRAGITDVLERNNKWLDHSSFGDWCFIVGYLGKKLRTMRNGSRERNQLEVLFAVDSNPVFELLGSKRLLRLLEEANSRRNDWTGHGGIVSADQARDRHAELAEYLSDFRHVIGDRWTLYSLLLPGENRYLAPVFHYTVEQVMGARTPFQKKRIEVEHPLENGQLHLYGRNTRRALPLLPFVQVRESPQTAQNACYFYNRIKSDGTRFVSYHFDREADITGPFEETVQALRIFQPSIG